MSTLLNPDEAQAIALGRHNRPFAVLGQHSDASGAIIRSFQPTAESLTVLAEDGQQLQMTRIHNEGVFALRLERPAGRYRLRATRGEHQWEFIDSYSMPSVIGELDRHLFNEGTHQRLYRMLGSHPVTHSGVDGVQFSVWAPNAQRVSVVGNFNQWDGRCHVMRTHPGSGVWDIFIPGLGKGTLYKYEIVAASGELLPLKHDPFATYFEQPPGNAAIVYASEHVWTDAEYRQQKALGSHLGEPVSVYEVHAGSWRHHDDDRPYSYRELADNLIPYVVEQGFTHIELMPITEHPYSPSWGYQPIGLYAPTSRFGSPDDFRHFVDRCHAAGVGVIMDWVPAHFPSDEHGLGYFDGTHLYEHADPRQGFHKDWNTLIYNYGRREVLNYLLSNAIYWVREFHLDGLRVDAVASMLYLDYSRNAGEWIPNEYGGRENLEAIDFLKRMNELVHAEGGFTLAEESTSFPKVSRPIYDGGLGFTFKWNMGWMHDTLEYMSRDSAYRKYHHNNLTFGLLYAFSENFVLPLSHDEVVYGKGSMINKMPGDDWQKFANLRACYAYMFTYPGKKLLFMGSEFAQEHEWRHAGQLDWHLLEQPRHRGMQRLVRDLNHLYASHPALYETDCLGNGFAWLDCEDATQSVISYYRYSKDQLHATITVCNFTPVVRHDYRIGVRHAGSYRELINTDHTEYGGSGQSNGESIATQNEAMHGFDQSISLTLPPLGVLVLEAI